MKSSEISQYLIEARPLACAVLSDQPLYRVHITDFEVTNAVNVQPAVDAEEVACLERSHLLRYGEPVDQPARGHEFKAPAGLASILALFMFRLPL